MHWLKALAWLENASTSIVAIPSSEAYIKVGQFSNVFSKFRLIHTEAEKGSKLYAFILDTERLAVHN